jgi:hypothetical protein
MLLQARVRRGWQALEGTARGQTAVKQAPKKRAHTWHMLPTIAAVELLSAPPDIGSRKPAAPLRRR